MHLKRLLRPDRVRRVPPQFSWVDHRLVRQQRLRDCEPPAWALYLFLVTVADARGLSFYSDASIARHELEVILARSPDDGLAWYNLGNLQRQLGEQQASEESFRKAIRFRPRLAEAHFNLGLTLMELNRPAEAVEPMARAVELARPNTELWKRAQDMLAIARHLGGESPL